MRITTFSYHGAVFAMQEQTVGSGVDAEYVAYLVAPNTTSNRAWRRALNYGAFLSTTTVKSGDPGFTVPTLDDAPETIVAFYATFNALPRAFQNAINAAYGALAIDANSADLTPGIDPKEPAGAPTENADLSSLSPSTEPSSISHEHAAAAD